MCVGCETTANRVDRLIRNSNMFVAIVKGTPKLLNAVSNLLLLSRNLRVRMMRVLPLCWKLK